MFTAINAAYRLTARVKFHKSWTFSCVWWLLKLELSAKGKRKQKKNRNKCHQSASILCTSSQAIASRPGKEIRCKTLHFHFGRNSSKHEILVIDKNSNVMEFSVLHARGLKKEEQDSIDEILNWIVSNALPQWLSVRRHFGNVDEI